MEKKERDTLNQSYHGGRPATVSGLHAFDVAVHQLKNASFVCWKFGGWKEEDKDKGSRKETEGFGADPECYREKPPVDQTKATAHMGKKKLSTCLTMYYIKHAIANNRIVLLVSHRFSTTA